MKIARVIFLLLLSVRVFGQAAAVLTFDEHGKYMYYQVARIADPNGTLQSVAKFLKENDKTISSITTRGDSAITASGKFVVNRGTGTINHPMGECTFTFVAERKGDKSRYWLTDFKFRAYQRDRYGNFVPEPRSQRALEKLAPNPETDKDGYLRGIGVQVKKFADALENAAARGELQKKAIDTRKW